MRRYSELCSLTDRKSLVMSKLHNFELELRFSGMANSFPRKEDGITESAARLDKYKPSVLEKLQRFYVICARTFLTLAYYVTNFLAFIK